MRRPLACLAAALLLTACSGEDDGSSSLGPTPSPSVRVPVATAKPTVTVPKGAPPEDLVQDDITVGQGPAVIPGQVVSVHYVLVDYASGKEIESSWGRNPFQFTLGNGDVIEGWDKGVLGMRVGGRRRLIVPPALAYGDDPATGGELAGRTLVFVVDVIAGGGAPAGAGKEQ